MVADYPAVDWAKVIDTNLLSTFHVNQALVRVMTAAGYGRIVNIASVAGKEGNPNASAYSAAKAGVIALTKSLGKETAKHNIAVNVVTPAAARTKLFEQMPQTHIELMLSKIPRGRFVEIDEVAAMVTWLLSEENASLKTSSSAAVLGSQLARCGSMWCRRWHPWLRTWS